MGVGWTVQLLPSHRAAHVTSEEVVATKAEPTAVQALAEAHDTPFTVTELKPSVGMGTKVQLAPSQTSANGVPPPP
jgi:hypothetical protein